MRADARPGALRAIRACSASVERLSRRLEKFIGGSPGGVVIACLEPVLMIRPDARAHHCAAREKLRTVDDAPKMTARTRCPVGERVEHRVTGMDAGMFKRNRCRRNAQHGSLKPINSSIRLTRGSRHGWRPAPRPPRNEIGFGSDREARCRHPRYSPSSGARETGSRRQTDAGGRARRDDGNLWGQRGEGCTRVLLRGKAGRITI